MSIGKKELIGIVLAIILVTLFRLSRHFNWSKTFEIVILSCCAVLFCVMLPLSIYERRKRKRENAKTKNELKEKNEKEE